MAVALVSEADRSQPVRKHHRAGLILLIILAVLVAMAVVVRLILDPVASYETRKSLGNMKGFRGDFARVHVTVLPPSYQISNLKLAADSAPAGSPPLLFVKSVHLGLDWRELLHGRLVASAALEEPKITLVPPKPTKEKAPGKTPDLSTQLKNAPPVRLSRLEVFSGELLVRLPVDDKRPRLWVHDLDVTGENLATRPGEAHGRATTLSARGLVARSGELRLFVTANPFASPLAFAGEASLQGLHAEELYAFLSAKTDIEATDGTIDLFATFTSKNGMVNGGVKPVLKNITLKSTDEGLWANAKTWLLDKSVDLASDRVPERSAIATTVPIKGKLVAPDIQLWPAVLGVVRNAFVAGLTSGFANLPPKTSSENEGVLKQATDALKKKSGPPEAQPREK